MTINERLLIDALFIAYNHAKQNGVLPQSIVRTVEHAFDEVQAEAT